MSIPLTIGAVAVFLATVSVIVLLARPHHGTNRTMAAILALYAGVTLAYGAMRTAASADEAAGLARTLVWYALPQPFLLALLTKHLYARRTSSGPTGGLLILGLATLTTAVAYLVAPERFVAGAARAQGTATYSLSSGDLYPFFTLVWYAAQLLVIVTSARAAGSAHRDRHQRQQAALVGLAFAFLVLPAGAWYLPLFIAYPNTISVGFFVRSGAALVVFAGTLTAVPKIVRAFDGPSRRAAMLAVALPIATGFFDGLNLVAITRGAPLLPGYDSSVLLWRAGFAAILATALFRYDLAGAGESLRAQLSRATRWGLVGSAALGAAGLVLALLGTTTAGLVTAVMFGGAALVLSPSPFAAVARSLTNRVVPAPRDDEAWRHRTRAYTEAVRNLRDADTGSFNAAATARLSRLREELELDERDHTLLVEAMGQAPEQPATSPLLGRYRLQRELARGATGTAVLALDPEGRRVVLKRFHAKAHAARALEEARTLAAIDHPNVLRLIEVDRVGDEIFLVTPYAENGTLADLVECGPIPPEDAVRHVIDAIRGLEALHAKGIVHRDIKPANLFLHEGRTWLGDLGAATQGGSVDATLTGDGVEGSLATLAPETLRGRAPTSAADVYAMGAVLYRILTGAHYVNLDGISAYTARERILHAPPRLPHPLVPDALVPLLRTVLAKTPSDRGTAAAMRESLERIAAQESWKTSTERPTPTT